MLEIEVHHALTVLRAGIDKIGVTAKHEPCKQLRALFAVANLFD